MQSEDLKNNNLKKIRKDKGLSIESVANSLKLTTDVIKKLESSDFENLGAYTYVRGYINHYAKLLDLDAQHYIELIPKTKLVVPLVNTSSSTSNTIKLKKHSKNLFNYAVGTFIVVAVSFSGYYLLKNYSSTSNNIEIVNSDNLKILPQQREQTNAQDQNTGNLNDDTFHYSSLIPTGDALEKQLDGDEIQIPAQNEGAIDMPLIDSTTITGLPSSDPNYTELSEAENVAPLMAFNIVIDATETSWVKVENQDGKLHNDLLKPGSISLSSDKPIHFRIGNEKNVKLTINGEEIDLSNYSSKDVADFNWPLES